MRNLNVVPRSDHMFDVFDGVEVVAGPFTNPDEANTWISTRRDGCIGLKAYPDDIIIAAVAVQARYLHRTAMEDLAQLIAAAIFDERSRCADLTMSMDRITVEVSKDLRRKPTFQYLANLIRRGG